MQTCKAVHLESLLMGLLDASFAIDLQDDTTNEGQHDVPNTMPRLLILSARDLLCLPCLNHSTHKVPSVTHCLIWFLASFANLFPLILIVHNSHSVEVGNLFNNDYVYT